MSNKDITIRLMVGTKTGEIKLKGFKDSVKRTEEQVVKSSRKIRTSFARIGEFWQKVFFGFQGNKIAGGFHQRGGGYNGP